VTRALDTGTDTVIGEVADGVGVITLNRPHRRNALHQRMYDAVPDLLQLFADDDEVGCVLLTGAGNAFCAGGDVRDGGTARSEQTGDLDSQLADRATALAHNARMVRLVHAMPKVTITALPGAAVGAGMSIALSSDLRVAARSARLIPGWSKLAFSGDFGGAWFLTKLVGPSRALDILLTDEPIGAEEALRLGLVNRVVDDAQLPTAALTWAKAIAAGPRAAFAAVKANIVDAQSLSLDEALIRESERMVRSGMTQEHRAAVKAWMAAAAAKTGAPA
jgi:2-(1,2-epoxy-1,2-dihydrophenyl)acetyl-CoA isomerase